MSNQAKKDPVRTIRAPGGRTRMMTEELFREDAFARQCDAKVVALADGGVCLDRTVFYCTGGGQPGDRGRLVLEDRALEVVDTIKGPGRHRAPAGRGRPRRRSAPACAPRSTGSAATG